MNGDETGVDCGGSHCVPCPTCTDSLLNGDELRIDCGGSCSACPPRCESLPLFPALPEHADTGAMVINGCADQPVGGTCLLVCSSGYVAGPSEINEYLCDGEAGWRGTGAMFFCQEPVPESPAEPHVLPVVPESPSIPQQPYMPPVAVEPDASPQPATPFDPQCIGCGSCLLADLLESNLGDLHMTSDSSLCSAGICSTACAPGFGPDEHVTWSCVDGQWQASSTVLLGCAPLLPTPEPTLEPGGNGGGGRCVYHVAEGCHRDKLLQCLTDVDVTYCVARKDSPPPFSAFLGVCGGPENSCTSAHGWPNRRDLDFGAPCECMQSVASCYAEQVSNCTKEFDVACATGVLWNCSGGADTLVLPTKHLVDSLAAIQGRSTEGPPLLLGGFAIENGELVARGQPLAPADVTDLPSGICDAPYCGTAYPHTETILPDDLQEFEEPSLLEKWILEIIIGAVTTCLCCILLALLAWRRRKTDKEGKREVPAEGGSDLGTICIRVC